LILRRFAWQMTKLWSALLFVNGKSVLAAATSSCNVKFARTPPGHIEAQKIQYFGITPVIVGQNAPVPLSHRP
jgi:hypothetical protein